MSLLFINTHTNNNWSISKFQFFKLTSFINKRHLYISHPKYSFYIQILNIIK